MGDLIQTKKCCRCLTEKPLNQFGNRPGRPDGKKYHCNGCATKWQIAKYAENPEKYRATNRAQGVIPKARFSRFKKRCKNTGKDFQLTFEQWSELVIDKTCHYCNGPLELKGCALDRKNNSNGYLINNVVPCCKECNRIKGPALSYDEMVAVSKLLKSMRNV